MLDILINKVALVADGKFVTWSKIFPLRVDPFTEERQTSFDTTVSPSPESVSIQVRSNIEGSKPIHGLKYISIILYIINSEVS